MLELHNISVFKIKISSLNSDRDIYVCVYLCMYIPYSHIIT